MTVTATLLQAILHLVYSCNYIYVYVCVMDSVVCNCRYDKLATTTTPYGVLRTGGDVLGYIGAGVRGRVSMAMAMMMA